MGSLNLKNTFFPIPLCRKSERYPMAITSDYSIIYSISNVIYFVKDDSSMFEIRHKSKVTAIKISPENKFIAIGDSTGNLALIDLAKLGKIGFYKTNDSDLLFEKLLSSQILDISWTSDEKYIAVCGNGFNNFCMAVKLTGERKILAGLGGPTKSCNSLCWLESSGEKILAVASDDSTVTSFLLDGKNNTFHMLKSFKDHKNIVTSVCFSSVNKLFATSDCEGKVNFYRLDFESLKFRHCYSFNECESNTLLLSPIAPGLILSVHSSGKIYSHKLKEDENIVSLESISGSLEGKAFSAVAHSNQADTLAFLKEDSIICSRFNTLLGCFEVLEIFKVSFINAFNPLVA
jgi:WD40 repeat protein